MAFQLVLCRASCVSVCYITPSELAKLALSSSQYLGDLEGIASKVIWCCPDISQPVSLNCVYIQ